jgi:DNA helicase-2/ATP-dependent DNA helicase PcrA
MEQVKLNKEQAVAVKHGDGPLLIIAGAGTGKTTVITERIKYLILSKNVKPNEVLALTFTEKAAREMEARVDVAMPYGYTQMWISTFHSFCDRLLRQEALCIGLDPRYKLMSEAEAVQLIRNNLFKFDLDYFRPLGNPTKFVDGMLQHFSRLQDEDVSPSDYLAWVSAKCKMLNAKSKGEEKVEVEKWKELAGAYKTYDELKTKEGLMDFGDLIVKTLKLFRDRPNILEEYRKQFKYVLVDEFQDTNYAQNELSTLLAGKTKNITVCGDDDQSIYRFRGAAVSNIIQFKKSFPEAKIVTLVRNYRSTQEILDRAYDLIQHNNPDRLEAIEKVDKKLVSMRKDSGEEIRLMHADRVENEADQVAKTIKKLQAEKKYDWKDFAILVRANNQSEPFVRAMSRHGIPRQFLGPGKLFKQPEVIDLISYLKVLHNFEDSVALYRLLSMDYFDISPRDLAALGNYARRFNLCLFEACEKIDDLFCKQETKNKIKKLLEIITKHLKLIRRETAGQLLYYFLSDTGLLPKLLLPDSPEAQKKAANISKFFDKLKTYEVDHEDATTPTVVDWIELSSELGESPLATDTDWINIDAVNILTAHSAKGLEFRVVFLVNLVSQRFPTIERREQIPISDGLIKEVLPVGDYHLEEERRLFYVGMTRAKDVLIFTAADYYGEGKREKKLSPFIFEALGDNVLSAEVGEDKLRQLSFLDYEPASPVEALAKSGEAIHVDYLSYSQIQTFKTCPMHYKLKYIYKIPTAPVAAQSFGISLHATLKEFYIAVRNGEKATEKLLLRKLTENWIREGFTSKTHEERFLAKAKEYLSDYLTHQFNSKITTAALEQMFTIPLTTDGKFERFLRIGGKVDRVDILPDGKIEIIDYKTGANVPTQKEIDNDLQMTFYAMAATSLREPPFNKKPEDVILTFYYFDNQKKISTVRTKEDLEKAKEEIFSARDEIEKSDFKCSGHMFCHNCEYSLFCRGES